MLAKRPFISPNELLLCVEEVDGRPFVVESAPLGAIFPEAKDAANHADRAHLIWRMNYETRRVEDVTEQCAVAFLDDFDGDPSDRVPPFVEFSKAWEDFAERFYRRRPSRQPHSTMNVVSLGLTSPRGNVVSFPRGRA